jgi:hypothetical protein
MIAKSSSITTSDEKRPPVAELPSEFYLLDYFQSYRRRKSVRADAVIFLEKRKKFITGFRLPFSIRFGGRKVTILPIEN